MVCFVLKTKLGIAGDKQIHGPIGITTIWHTPIGVPT